VQGTEILFASRSLRLSERAAAQLAERAGCHDLPYAAAHFEAGDPVCSVSASGPDPEQVLELLTGRREALRSSLELQQ
jgi:predicted ATP-grasp superfamily ATP-dependent carboligase